VSPQGKRLGGGGESRAAKMKMVSPPDVISCGAVVYRKEGSDPVYLLLQYTARHWDFPKGHMEEGESEEQTTRREVQEETGITDLVFIPGFRRTIRYSYSHRRGRVRKMVVYALAKTQAPRDAVVLSHEHIGFGWYTYQDAMRQLTYKNARIVLERAHQFLLKQGIP
jgi:bis(5'-nucleosidyl)-tetraphosphatase